MEKNSEAGYFFLLCVTILMMSLIISSAAAAFKNLAEGMNLPAFTLKDLDDNDVSSEILKGKRAVIIVFFATWSERSLEELRDLEEMKSSLTGQDLEMIAINVDHEHMGDEDIAKVKQTVEDLGVSFTVLLDPGLEVYRGFGVVAVPSTAVVRSEGVLSDAINGYPTFAKQEIRDKVEVLLGIKKEEAVAALEETGYKPTRTSLLNYNLGRRLYLSGMLAKAERKLKIAIKSDENFARPKVILGDIYLIKSSKNKKYLIMAKDMYTKALEVSPDDEAAATGLARVLLKEGNNGEAEKQVDGVLARNPAFTHALIVKALILTARGETAESDRYAREAVSLAPMNPEILAMVGTVYEGNGNMKAAAMFYRKAGEKLGF